MRSSRIVDLLAAYVEANAALFRELKLSPEEACTRLMWDVEIDPDEVDLPDLIDQVCASV